MISASEKLQDTRLDSLNLHKMLRARQRMEARKEDSIESKQEAKNYFAESAKDLAQDKSAKAAKEFKNYIVEGSDISQEAEQSSFDTESLQSAFESYMDDQAIDTVFEYVDDEHVSRESADNLLEGLTSCEDENVEAMLGGFIKENKLSIAEIYVLLGYLYDELQKKKEQKDKLRKLLKLLLKKLSQQNSSYLFEFFSLTNHPQVKKNPKLASAMANLSSSSGEVDVVTVRDAIAFIRDHLDGDFSNLVSKCMRVRTHILMRLTNSQNSFENKSETTNFMRFEKNLIVVNSVYSKVNDFKKDVTDTKVWEISLAETNAPVMEGVVGFSGASIVTELGIKNLLKSLGVVQDLDSLTGFRNKLIQLFSGMPIEVFNNGQNSSRQKIIQGLRGSFSFANDNNVTKGHFDDFLKPKKRLLNSFV